ncbi:hypothetical protein P9422_18615 [Bacillus atrophaeus]|uniref:hypothetical protein n=1 Tax=Bacillus atrophaeus TaxID=1452 RepID=UPI002E1EFDA9|nr:hypothetical protein [Bacillus atrophaeus]
MENLKLNGSGSAAGGAYHKVTIRGEGIIGEGLVSNGCRIFGTGRFLGDAEVNKFTVFGESKVDGSLTAQHIGIFGTMKVGDDLHFEEMKMKGTADAAGSVAGHSCDVKGTLRVKGDCETEIFRLTGSLEVGGLLNAGEVAIGLRFGRSSVKEIGGTSITIKNNPGFFKRGGTLTADLIEGDTIYIENTQAAVVRGKHIKIGPGCKIGKLEYLKSGKINEEK